MNAVGVVLRDGTCGYGIRGGVSEIDGGHLRAGAQEHALADLVGVGTVGKMQRVSEQVRNIDLRDSISGRAVQVNSLVIIRDRHGAPAQFAQVALQPHAVGGADGDGEVYPLHGHAVVIHQQRGGARGQADQRGGTDEGRVRHYFQTVAVGVYALYRNLAAVSLGVADHHAGIGADSPVQSVYGGLYLGEVAAAVLGHVHRAAAAGRGVPVNVAGRIVFKKEARSRSCRSRHGDARPGGQPAAVDVNRYAGRVEPRGGNGGDKNTAVEVYGGGSRGKRVERDAGYGQGRRGILGRDMQAVPPPVDDVGGKRDDAGVLRAQGNGGAVSPGGDGAGREREPDVAVGPGQARRISPGGHEHAAAYDGIGGTGHVSGRRALQEGVLHGTGGAVTYEKRPAGGGYGRTQDAGVVRVSIQENALSRHIEDPGVLYLVEIAVGGVYAVITCGFADHGGTQHGITIGPGVKHHGVALRVVKVAVLYAVAGRTCQIECLLGRIAADQRGAQDIVVIGPRLQPHGDGAGRRHFQVRERVSCSVPQGQQRTRAAAQQGAGGDLGIGHPGLQVQAHAAGVEDMGARNGVVNGIVPDIDRSVYAGPGNGGEGDSVVVRP